MNTLHALPALSSLSALLMLAACAPKYYSPNAQNVPLLTAQGEATVSGGINADASRADARGAWAVGRNLALQASTALYFPRDDDSGNGGSGALFEAGAGYFKPLPNRLVFETWGLVAYGGLENHFETGNPNGKLNANLTRVSILPALGYKHPAFEAAVSSRVAMLNYFNVSGSLTRDGASEAHYLRENRMQYLVEPAITVRSGLKSVKAEAQAGWSVNLTDDAFPQDGSWLSLGIVYLIR